MRAWTKAQAGCGVAIALTVAACAPQNEVASVSAPQSQTAAAPLPAAGPRPNGASIAAMSDQYAGTHPGAVPAAGASAWVAPSPPPAFTISTPLPPADPPAPPPAAVANRQPASPAPAPAAPARAQASPPTPAPAAPAVSVDLAKGRQLFSQYACGGCHVLADGSGTGGIGPALDNNPKLTRDYVIGAVSEGRGAMPAFRDQMTADEIATLAAYIVQVTRK